MSLEQKIEELTGTVAALTEIMSKVAHNQERLIAGQQAAIEKVTAGNPEKATRGRKPKTEPTDTPITSEKAADTESGAEDASDASESTAETTAASNSAAPAAEKPKLTFAEAAKKWLDNAEKGSDEYKSRGTKIMGILGHFGAGKMSELDAADEDKAMFYLKRHAKGMPVNYDAAYDFAGPVDQPEPAAEAAGEDDDDMFN